MSLKSRLVPPLAAALTSRRLRDARRLAAELRRRLTMKPHVVDVYLHIGDPYSHLLVQVLDSLTEAYLVEIQLRAVAELPAVMTPDPERLAAWARVDATRVADLYELAPPGPERSTDDIEAASLLLAEACGRGLQSVRSLFDQMAAGGEVSAPVDAADAASTLRANERVLARDGHYMPAMLFYGGEWYWGIDRLNHLEDRLIGAELARHPDAEPTFVRRLELLEEPAVALPSPPPLIAYWSARSPYSYLALARLKKLADAFSVPLEIRPVLPMVMRDLAVPRPKRFYLLLDGKREADILGIPYGWVCDPLGDAVERCYAVFDHAKEEGKAYEWVLSFATAVWSEGVNAASDDGLRAIATRAGLDPARCLERVSDQSWREWEARHRSEMLEGGFWGVPIIRFGDTWVWGQDRFWVLEEAMRAHGES